MGVLEKLFHTTFVNVKREKFAKKFSKAGQPIFTRHEFYCSGAIAKIHRDKYNFLKEVPEEARHFHSGGALEILKRALSKLYQRY